jgi:hypothetical protein
MASRLESTEYREHVLEIRLIAELEKNSSLKEEIQLLKAQNAQLVAIQATWSWKITRPLRIIRRIIDSTKATISEIRHSESRKG